MSSTKIQDAIPSQSGLLCGEIIISVSVISPNLYSKLKIRRTDNAIMHIGDFKFEPQNIISYEEIDFSSEVFENSSQDDTVIKSLIRYIVNIFKPTKQK